MFVTHKGISGDSKMTWKAVGKHLGCQAQILQIFQMKKGGKIERVRED